MSLLLLELSDTERVDIINKLGYISDPDSQKVVDYSLEAIELSEKASYSKGRIEAYGNWGWTLMVTGHYNLSKEKWNKALDYATTDSNLHGQAQAYNGLGVLHENEGRYLEALEYHLLALEILKLEGNERGAASSYSNIGSIHLYLEDYSSALEYYQKAIKIDLEQGNQIGLASAYNNIGNLYSTTEEYDKGLEYYQKALEIKEELGKPNEIASTLNNIGSSYLLMGRIEESINYNQRSLELYRSTNAKTRLAIPMVELGNAYNAYGDYSKALEYLKDGLQMAENIGEIRTIRDAHKGLSSVYTNLNIHDKALQEHLIFSAIADSLGNQELQLSIAKLTAKNEYQIAKDSLKLAHLNEQRILKKDIENRKLVQNATLIALILSSLIAIILFLFFRSKALANKELQLASDEIDKQKDEINFRNKELKKLNNVKDKMFSIISHDLKSPVAALQSLIFLFKTEDGISQDEFNDYLERLSENVEGVSSLLTNLLEWSRLQLKGDAAIAPDELELPPYLVEVGKLYAENIINKDLSLELEIDEGIPKLLVDPSVLRFLLRNLVNNAIKFSGKGDSIVISASQKNNKTVIVSVKDNGIGISAETQKTLFNDLVKSEEGTQSEKGTGLGLLLCREFIELSGGEIGVQSSIGQGSIFWFTVPVYTNI